MELHRTDEGLSLIHILTGRPYLGITYLAVTDAQTASQLGVNAYGVYVVEAVSYTHLDVYKRQVWSWWQTASSPASATPRLSKF